MSTKGMGGVARDVHLIRWVRGRRDHSRASAPPPKEIPMSKQTAETLGAQLDAVTKALDKEIAEAKTSFEKHALKMWRGIIGRVAVDLREFGK